MREFRFRVWDADNNTMTPPEEACIDFVFLEGRFEPEVYLLDRKKLSWKQIPLSGIMQSTARHDRHGTEIFEGDIVKTPQGRVVIRQRSEWQMWMSHCAVVRPELLQDPACRVFVVGSIGNNSVLPPIVRSEAARSHVVVAGGSSRKKQTIH